MENQNSNNLPEEDMDAVEESPKPQASNETPPMAVPTDEAGRLFIDQKELHLMQEKSKIENMSRRFAVVRQQWAIAQYPLRKAIKADNRDLFDAILERIGGDIVDLCIVGMTWFADSRLYDAYINAQWGDGIEFTDHGLLRSLRSETPSERRKSIQGILVLEESSDKEAYAETMDTLTNTRDSASELLMTRLKRSRTRTQ